MTNALVPSRRRRPKLAYRIVDAVLRRGLRMLPFQAWVESVALWWGYRFRPEPALVLLRSGAKIRTDRVDYLQLLIYYLGVFEPHAVEMLRRSVNPGATVVDVGANIGVYSIESALAVGPNGRVISIEAAPGHVQKLRENIQLNRMTNVVVVEAALGAAPGEGRLSLPDGDNLGMFTLGSVSGSQSHLVAVRTLDDILDELGVDRVDFVKMDIEGSEYHALCGAQARVMGDRPTILIELNEVALRRCNSSSAEVKKLLDNFGYQGWVVGRRLLAPINDLTVEHHCDECLFIHRSNASLMHDLGVGEAQR
jgi:FkbM family methyltransferase